MTNQVIDASSLLLLIKRSGDNALEILKASRTIPLIHYEVGNALRTSTAIHHHLTPREAEEILEKIHEALKLVNVMRQETIRDHKQILHNSLDHNITYYDSAYLTAALDKEAPLLTEDRRLAGAATSANITTVNVDQIMKRKH